MHAIGSSRRALSGPLWMIHRSYRSSKAVGVCIRPVPKPAFILLGSLGDNQRLIAVQGHGHSLTPVPLEVHGGPMESLGIDVGLRGLDDATKGLFVLLSVNILHFLGHTVLSPRRPPSGSLSQPISGSWVEFLLWRLPSTPSSLGAYCTAPSGL